MIKIIYKDIEKIKVEYQKLIESQTISLELKSNSNNDRKEFIKKLITDLNIAIDAREITINELYKKSLQRFEAFKSYEFQSFLTENFEINKDISNKLGIMNNSNYPYIDEIFNYEKLQPVISKFFEEYIRPITCYYCNIDFINVFQKSYDSILHFLNTASFEELKTVDGIGETTANKIIKERKKREYDQNSYKEKLEKKVLRGLNNFDYENVKPANGFTLDHVIDKGKHPYLALSLFNLVPSCYTCNSKLKRSESIGSVSPTDDSFDFHEKVKFKTFIHNSNLKIEAEDDLHISLKELNSSKYIEYLNVFRLNDRYAFHRYRVIEMIDKRKRYPDSRIIELAKLTGQTTMQVKKDLFGEYLYNDDLSKRPLSKLTHDIAEELGLI